MNSSFGAALFFAAVAWLLAYIYALTLVHDDVLLVFLLATVWCAGSQALIGLARMAKTRSGARAATVCRAEVTQKLGGGIDA